MTEVYLVKVINGKIVIPASKNVKNGDVIEVMVNRVFVDETMKKRIEKKGVVRIIDG
jgi:ribosomal 50S subunit-recycling heat shock protein